MGKKYKAAFLILYFIGLLAVLLIYIKGHDIAVLNPSGLIADRQRDLILTATLLMLVVVIPVFIMTFTFAWRYREGNKKAKYTPDWDHHTKLEFIWWAIPGIIISILAVITWQSSHELDPFKPISSDVKPVKVQVVALQWRWLFIYPEQNIASLNYVQFPEGTPVNFEITSDAPMNSFWIPKLGGQVYAMSGMTTKLHLMAGVVGDYEGSSANLSGDGFAGMKFLAKASSKEDFDRWVQLVQSSSNGLDANTYVGLSKPSKETASAYYSLKDSELYDKVIMKYMTPGYNMTEKTQEHMDHMHMGAH